MAAGDITMSFIFALFVHLFFEAPLGGIQKMLLKKSNGSTIKSEEACLVTFYVSEPKKPAERPNNAVPPAAAEIPQNNNVTLAQAPQAELAVKPKPFEDTEFNHEQAAEEVEMTQAPSNLQENIDIEQAEDV
jgi:hypothetical protein